MKQLLLALILFSLALPGNAQSGRPTVEQQHLRDSLFNVYQAMPRDSSRITFLLEMFQQNLGQKWTLELLDSALILTQTLDTHEKELMVRFTYFRFYHYTGNVPKMESTLNSLREKSYQYQLYNRYFTACTNFLLFKSAMGDIEFATLGIKQVKEEARRLQDERGMVLALLVEGKMYVTAEKYKEAVQAFDQAMASPEMTPSLKMSIHTTLSNIYTTQKQYPQAVEQLDRKHEIIQQLIREKKNNFYKYKSRLLETELEYTSIYCQSKMKDSMKSHLDRARTYYSEDCFFANFMEYHILWANYYSLISQPENCIRELDIVLATSKKVRIYREISVRRMKAEALYQLGRVQEASQCYARAVITGDSLNASWLHRHEEVLKANYEINQALLHQQKTEQQINWLITGGIIGIFLAILILLGYTLHSYRVVRHSQKVIADSLATVDAANKMKDVFLRNITNKISIPLNKVVELSELLTVKTDLSQAQIEEYAEIIKKNSAELICLVNDILELSRLESGMMRFTVQECDAVQLCRDTGMMVATRRGNKPVFSTTTDSLMIQTDSDWFMKVLEFALDIPEEYPGNPEINYTLLPENGFVRILVEGSPMAVAEPGSVQCIRRDISRVFLETFGGSYQINTENDYVSTIIISFPYLSACNIFTE